MMKVDARNIKSAANVEPVGRTDYSLIAKEEDLAPCKRIGPTRCRTTDLNVPLPKGPTVLERVSIGGVVIEKDARVLHFPVKLQPIRGLNRHIHAQAVQQVKITCVCEAGTHRSLETITIFAANMEPARQRLVEFVDRK